MKNNLTNRRGFTIVELMIVIFVIGLLAAVTLVAYGSVQKTVRDTKRISDLQTISDAIKSYRIENKNDIQTGSGCASAGNGNGWFNYVGGTYPASMLSCLIAAGYLDDSYIDPSGCTTTSSPCVGKGVYMKYSCGSGDTAITYLYARLEASGNTQDLIDANVCSSSGVATSFGMNYMLVVD